MDPSDSHPRSKPSLQFLILYNFRRKNVTLVGMTAFSNDGNNPGILCIISTHDELDSKAVAWLNRQLGASCPGKSAAEGGVHEDGPL